MDANRPQMNLRERRKKRRQEWIQFVLNIFQGICLFCSALYYFCRKVTIRQPDSILSWIFHLTFASLSLLAFGLWMWARIQLGIYLTFSAKAEDRLITTGLYGIFRHPIYYFGTAAMLFYIVLLEKYYYLLILVVLIPVQVIRASREDVVLKKSFGEEFVNYRKSCWI